MKGSQALGQIKSPEHIIMDMTLYPEEINIPKILHKYTGFKKITL